ncbi:MAG TPA: hypothetical protein ENL10_00240 [Candidatus Cloacimonetes bacterium]|nr:hypothetical protein [Candidatus Cloacimonadota bacterium]
MEEFIKYLKFRASSENSVNALQSGKSALLKKPGILEVSVVDQTMVVGYNTYAMSKEELTTFMNDMGLEPNPDKVKKGRIVNWLDNLAKTNKESFGTKKLDCCDMNHAHIAK